MNMNMQQLMKQAQKMQEQMQKQMESTVVDATAGGMVSVKMNGSKQLLSVQVDQEVFAGGDKEMLQDLIVAAVNEAVRKVDEALAGHLGGFGLKIPGLF